MSSFIAIALITKTRGIRGEVSAVLLTDFPDRFAQLDRVLLYSDDFETWERLEGHWFHKDRVILKFEGIDSVESVSSLVGCEVRILEEDRVALPDDFFFDYELQQCEVYVQGEYLGQVVDVLSVAGSGSNLIIALADGQELMLPFVKQFVAEVDLQNKRISINLLPGLLDTAHTP